MEILTQVKSLLRMGATDTTNDEILEALIYATSQFIFTTCNRSEEDIDAKVTALIADMVVMKYHRLGAEGMPSSAISVISDNYFSGTDDFPKSITSRYGSIRRPKVWD